LDSYRLILFLAMVALGIAAFIADYFLNSWEILKINYDALKPLHVLVLFLFLLFDLLFYILISKLTKRLIFNKEVPSVH
ncbi:MAG: hypothetical protein WC282_04935, partial [Bacilli bacterium]